MQPHILLNQLFIRLPTVYLIIKSRSKHDRLHFGDIDIPTDVILKIGVDWSPVTDVSGVLLSNGRRPVVVTGIGRALLLWLLPA